MPPEQSGWLVACNNKFSKRFITMYDYYADVSEQKRYLLYRSALAGSSHAYEI